MVAKSTGITLTIQTPADSNEDTIPTSTSSKYKSLDAFRFRAKVNFMDLFEDSKAVQLSVQVGSFIYMFVLCVCICIICLYYVFVFVFVFLSKQVLVYDVRMCVCCLFVLEFLFDSF